MTFSLFLRVLRAHGRLILVTLLLVLAAAAAVSLVMPRKYTAGASIVVDFRGNPISGALLPAQLFSGYVTTQMDIIASQTVALKVVDELRLAEDAQARQRFLPSGINPLDELKSALARWLPGWLAGEEGEQPSDGSTLRYRLAEQLLQHLDVKPSPDSSVLRISYSAPEPAAAAQAANAFVNAYMATNLELNVNPARQSSDWFSEQTKVLADNLARARQKYSAYQQQVGIVAADEHMDVENARLSELSSQLVAAQAQNHPAIQALKGELARAEAKLNQLPGQLGPNHPQYRAAQAEVASLRSRLAAETRRILGDVQGQIASQRAKVLQMKKYRAELDNLKNEVDNAQRALDEAMQRAAQVRMESQVNQTNVSLLRSAVPPVNPSSPNLPLNLALAAVIGLVLSVGLALWRELSQRLVRGREDLKELLGVPVIGVLHAGGNVPAGPRAFERLPAPRLIGQR
ncbi:MAG: Wzz/FepE/Etk N-terminal domain-containing protein [Pseudomonadota bacterium]